MPITDSRRPSPACEPELDVKGGRTRVTLTVNGRGLGSQLCLSTPLSDEPELLFLSRRRLSRLTRRFRTAAKANDRDMLLKIGQELYRMLGGEGGALGRALAELAAGIFFEIVVGKEPSPEELLVLDAPWQILADAGRFLLEDYSVRLFPLRRIGRRKPPAPAEPGPLATMLVAAAPVGMTMLRHTLEEELLVQRTESLPPHDLLVELTGTKKGMTITALDYRELGGKLNVLILNGHGTVSPKPALILEDELRKPCAVDLEQLLDTLGGSVRDLGLIVLGACSSALRSDQFHSLAAALVRAGARAVLGYDASVTDSDAIEFNARLLSELTKRDADLETAVAIATRAQLLAGRACWSNVQLLLAADGGGRLCKRGGRPLLPRPSTWSRYRGEHELYNDIKMIRRGLIRRAIFALWSERSLGVVLRAHAPVDSASLAEGVLRGCAVRLRPVMLKGRFTPRDVITTIARAQPSLFAWRDEWLEQADQRLEDALTALLLRGDLVQDLALVLEDFDALLEPGDGDAWQVQADAEAMVRAIFSALRHAPGRSRIVVTTTKNFVVRDEKGQDLSVDLAELFVRRARRAKS